MSASRLYQTITAAISELIESGEFPPGTRLPGERDLAERFGVSRVTIREAEIALEAQGWITIKTGSGAYVRPRLDARGALPDVSAFDVTAARAVIEAEAAAIAAQRISDTEIAELAALIGAMAQSDADDHEAEDADQKFHLAIARISGNPVIEHCVQVIWRMRNELPRVRHAYARVCHHDATQRTSEHDSILAALREHDPAAAREAMRSHFERLFESMLEASENEALQEVRRRTQQHRDNFFAATRLHGIAETGNEGTAAAP
ncbi:MAG: FadR family transcriptional regulator [Proteobacteria bacterium]|nr:FadR family transcriptional regulator [Pseudomonadota bacterium]